MEFFIKLSGGPGSGVAGENTEKIDMPLSEYISVGTRKGLLDNMEYEEKEIDMAHIKCVCQEKCVPAKVERMMGNFDEIKDLPIDVLEVGKDNYHVIDGHHRFLVHRRKKSEKIKVRSYKRREKDAAYTSEDSFCFKLANDNLSAERINSIAKSKTVSQAELARQLGVSVKGLRKYMKDNDISWRNVNGYRQKRKAVRDIGSGSIKKNTGYKNPKRNGYKPDYGGGYLNVR